MLFSSLCIRYVDLKKMYNVNVVSYVLFGRQHLRFWRNCSKEAAGRVSIYVILVKEEYMEPDTYFSRKFLLVL